MNSTSSSLLAKVFAAMLGFGLMAAVPLLTMQYVARAHAAAPATVAATCPGVCLADASADAPQAAPASCPACASVPSAKN